MREAVRAAGCQTPVVLSGGISTFEQAEELLRSGAADIVASARQSLADPDWFRKLRLGLGEEVRRCVFTNYCEGLDQVHKPVTCKLWDHLDWMRRCPAHRRRPPPAGGPGVGAGRQVKVAIVGAGPAGLYLAILLKRDDPSHQVTVYERNRVEDTFGFGVVFSDETLENVGEADPETNQAMAAAAARWEDIEIHYRGTVMRSTGHRFSGVERKTLLELLAGRAQSLGVEIHWQREIRDLVGLRSSGRRPDRCRRRRREPDPRPMLSDRFQPHLDCAATASSGWAPPGPSPRSPSTSSLRRPGSGARTPTSTPPAARPSSSRHGRRPGRRADSTRMTSRPRSRIWSAVPGGAPGTSLLANRSIWRRFPTVRNARWHAGNVVLLGDAAHTAHFSVGSGTKLAMEDAIALAAALKAEASIPAALASYEADRRPQVESLQRAAQASLEWFESVERYHDTEPLQFAFNLLTRSLRITHENLRVRDPALVAQVDRWFAEQASAQSGRPVPLPIPARHRCSRPTGFASWCCPTGSWCPRCASTGRTTDCRTTGTWCTSAAGRSAVPGW